MSNPDLVTVTLGGTDFEIQRANIKRSREWRQKFGEPLQVIIGVLQQADNIQIDSMAGAAGLLEQVGSLLLNSVDLLIEALFDYSPALQAEREWIEDNATDLEAMNALWEVIQIVYPFGSLMNKLPTGLTTNGTSKNSAKRSGKKTRSR